MRRVKTFWWLSGSGMQFSLKLPKRTSNLSSSNILLACTSLFIKSSNLFSIPTITEENAYRSAFPPL